MQTANLEIAKLFVSVLTPLTVAMLGYWFTRHFKRVEQDNITQNQLRQEEQSRNRDEIERRHKPHIELSLECNFFGPHHGWYIAEFVIIARNASLIRHEFRDVVLRVLGIRQDEAPTLWGDHGDRLNFGHKLLKTNVVPQDWNFIFIEPGVTQLICYISRIPVDYRFLVVKAEFYYDKSTPHTTERMFEVGGTIRSPDTAAKHAPLKTST